METNDNKDHDKKYNILYKYITEAFLSVILPEIFVQPLFPLRLSLAGLREEAKIIGKGL